MKKTKFLLLTIVLLLNTIVYSQVVPSIDKKSNGKDDGRFTLGTDGKRLMYGYPIPTSTSHFVVMIDGKYASNNPSFHKQAAYISGENKIISSNPAIKIQTKYLFRQVEIIQTLIPISRSYKEAKKGEVVPFYKVEYSFRNLTNKQKKIGLLVLFDTMIDDNDACVLDADTNRVKTETSYLKPKIPNKLLIYHVPDDKKDLLGLIITKKNKLITPPDELIIGSWPNLSTVVWNYSSSNNKYYDSAVLFKWKEKLLKGNETRKFSTLIGIPINKNKSVSLLMKDKSVKHYSKTVYFDIGKSDIDYNATIIIDKLFKNKNVLGVFINGYSDYIGGDTENLKLSEKRIESVAKYIKKYTSVYIPKSYGSMKAKKEEKGNPLDRKVVIEVYFTKRTHN